MKYIYIITMLGDIEYNKYVFGKVANERWVVGWYNEFEEAEKIVLNNTCWIDDGGVYDYAVIEKVREGLHGFSVEYDNESIQFYKADDSYESYSKCERPEGMKGVGFWQ